MLGLRPGGCREVLERRDHLHGKTHIHMQEHVSTQCVPWTFGTSSRADRRPGLPPLQGLSPMEGEAYPGDHASLTCATGERMLPQGGGVRRGKGAGFLAASQNHPVLSCGQGSLYMNTPLPGSPRGGGGGREEVGEGMREYDSGVQIPAEIL